MPTTLQDSITRIVTYPHPIDRVWAAITAPEHLIHFTWDTEHYQAPVTEVEPPTTLVLRWRTGSRMEATSVR